MAFVHVFRNFTNFPDFHWFHSVESIGSDDGVLVPDGNTKSSKKVAAQVSPRDRVEDCCDDDDGLSAEHQEQQEQQEHQEQQGKGALEPADGERSPLLPSSSSSIRNDATLGK